ncbi:MAG TPA: galactokinase [Acidimicrobiia bacterium]|nr:galactokinase [Acidimicrobiia bacterium]
MGDARLRALVDAIGGGDGTRVVRAPGRVNLIGDHTDYNDGLVLPLAIDRDCMVASHPRPGARVAVHSLDFGERVDVAVDGSDDIGAVEPVWGRFVVATLRALAEHGTPAEAMEMAVASTVPIGSGLSSSAAFTVVLALAAADGQVTDRRELARMCQRAEHLATGVPSGLMDQLASLFGQAGHLLLVDCHSLAIEPVPVPPGLAVLVVHSGVSRALAASGYAERRAACEAIAARLGVPALRDARPEQVVDEPRARHVVSENQRVIDTAAALRAGDVNAMGPLLLASHASLRDDFEVSTPELDLLVDLLVEGGAVGARLTGAGFGGCVVALVQRNHADDLAAKTVHRYRDATGLGSSAFVVRAVDGAGPVDLEAP